MLELKYRINSKRKLSYALECDREALHINRRKPSLIPFKQKTWKFERLLRHTE